MWSVLFCTFFKSIATRNEIGSTLSKIKKLVEHFRKSATSMKKLQDTQKLIGLHDLKLKQDVPTLWNSTFEMLDRVLKIKEAFISTTSLVRPDLLVSRKIGKLLPRQ